MSFLCHENPCRNQIGEDGHRRHAHSQKCRRSEREQKHQKIKEGVDQVGMAVVVKVAEEEYKEVYNVYCSPSALSFYLSMVIF